MINSGKEFDLVLSDFTLPAFNGFAALKLAKEKMPEVPFILLSGEVCEEQAVEAMKLGATDYVFKHRMVRLGPAVKRAWDECEKRKEYKRAQEKAEEEIIKVNVKEKIIVKTDEHIFTKVLSNLVSNAVKYTDKGNITITIDKAQSGGKNAALIKVIDTGIGIPEENYKKIFEHFRQGSEGLNRNYEGLGLGLTITKKFVDMMEGELYLESSLNKGSVFSLLIPIKDEIFNMDEGNMKQITDANYATAYKKQYDILIVEDDQT